jgi:hypothetical protein
MGWGWGGRGVGGNESFLIVSGKGCGPWKNSFNKIPPLMIRNSYDNDYFYNILPKKYEKATSSFFSTKQFLFIALNLKLKLGELC